MYAVSIAVCSIMCTMSTVCDVHQDVQDEHFDVQHGVHDENFGVHQDVQDEHFGVQHGVHDEHCGVRTCGDAEHQLLPSYNIHQATSKP